MNSAREQLEIDHFVTSIMDKSLQRYQTNRSFDSSKSDLNSSPLSPVFEEILLTDSSPTTTSAQFINNNALESSETDRIISVGPNKSKILSSIGSYFIHSPRMTRMTNFIDTQSKPSAINTKKEHFFHETIRFAQKDASNEVKDVLINKRIAYFPNADQQKLLQFLQNHLHHHQWPLSEYIGVQGYRAWRAFKLAADISCLDQELTSNYHQDLDWLQADDDFGSFHERIDLVLRNFHQRLAQQDRC